MSSSRERSSKKGAEESASFSNEGSAVGSAQLYAGSIMDWAADLWTPSGNNNAQDSFNENPKKSPLRHRRNPSAQGNYPTEQPVAVHTRGVPNWEGTTITANAMKADDVSVMTPFGGDTQLNYSKTTLPNTKQSSASTTSNEDNWDKFEMSLWDSFPDQSSRFSESEEGSNVVHKKQPARQPRNKRKLIWIGSVAVFLIVIIAIAVPLAKKSQSASAANGNENISIGSENDTTVPAEVDSTPIQPEPSLTEDEGDVNGQATQVPEDEGFVNGQATTVPVDEGYVNGQATTVPVESNPAPLQPGSSPANQPISLPVSTITEPKPAPSEVAPESEPISSPVSALNEPKPSPSAPVPAQNNEPVSQSTVDEPKPSPPAPLPAQNNEPASVPVESGSSPAAPVPAQNNEPVSGSVVGGLESSAAAPVTAQNNEPAPVSVESEASPAAPVPAQNSVPAPESVVGESEPSPAQNEPVPAQNNEPVSSPVANVVELSIQEEPASSPNNGPVESSNNQQGTESNPVGSQPTPALPSPAATPQSAAVPNSPQTPKPTQLPTLPPTPSCINVQITADKFGPETSWVLKDVDRNRVLGSVSEDTYDAFEEDSQDFCGLEAGKYTFTIRDKYGDGMCCGNGRGRYRVFLNGKQMFWGGYFKKELSFDIMIGYDPGALTEREYQYWVGHNRRRKEFHEKHGTEYVPLAWSHSLAERARVWATSLLDECDDVSMRHDPNRNGDGENLAKNLGSSASAGLGQLYPVESIMNRWVEREMEWDWPDNAHLTQALWRGSKYVGCADVEETKSDGSICRVQVCRYRRSGNCDMNAFKGDWLTAVLQDESTCGEQCPNEGCYQTSLLT